MSEFGGQDAGATDLLGKSALLVIDIQRGGAMGAERCGIGLMAGFDSLVANAEHLVAAARESGAPVIFFQEVHRRSGVDFGRELDGVEREHCLEGDESTGLWPTLVPADGESLIVKRRYSGFFGTELEILLRGLGVETLVLCGTLTDVCVHYTFADAHQRDFHLRVAIDAVLGSSVERHLAALDQMGYLQRAAPASTAALVAAFGARTAATELNGHGRIAPRVWR